MCEHESQKIAALDPGPLETGYVVMDEADPFRGPLLCGVQPNRMVALQLLSPAIGIRHLVVENVSCYGQLAGRRYPRAAGRSRDACAPAHASRGWRRRRA